MSVFAAIRRELGGVSLKTILAEIEKLSAVRGSGCRRALFADVAPKVLAAWRSSVASTTYSKSARAMLEALLSGVSDPEQLAELSKARMRLKIPQLREALQSRFQIEHHGIMVAQLLAHIDTLDAALQNLTERIELVLVPHAEIIELLCTIPASKPRPRRSGSPSADST